MQPSSKPGLGQHIAALAVHVYTASGVILAFLITVAAIRGDLTQALWLGLLAMFIDGTDGMLARRFRVSEWAPEIDGALLDNISDYLTYAFVPIVLLWQNGFLPPGTAGIVLAAIPLFASAYQFCRVDAKTEDHFFLGFPSYWNIIAFYAIVTNMSQLTLSVILVVCAILVFVPIYYVYPSRTLRFRKLSLAVSGLFLLSYALILLGMPTPNQILVTISILCILYYVGISLYMTYLRNTRRLGVSEQ